MTLEGIWNDEFAFADELERLGYMSPEIRAELRDLQLERRGTSDRGYLPLSRA